MSAPTKVYRYALFGRSDSGKTCILTAMSMSHRSNPAGYTVTWIPDPPEADDRDPEIAKQYQEGKAMLLRARAAMDSDDKPQPTPLRIHKYRFDFTTRTPHPRTYHAELTDYSGELIDPRMNAEALARKLRGLLNSMDGLFVLAEAPRVGEEGARMSREFELLQQAFALLANERKNHKGEGAQTPVVLMFNKWDRRFPGTASADQRASQIDDFLCGDPEPPHKSLADFLAGAVSEGCFHSIAVSAFGQARLETRTDSDGTSRQVELPPLTRPLPSYGLEDGFVWAAQRQDELELAEYENRTRSLAYANLFPCLFLNAFWPQGAAEVRREGTALASRFPKTSEAYRRTRAGAGKAMRVAALRTATVAVSLFALLLGGEAMFDVWRIRKAEADIARQGLSVEDISRHKGLLEAYQKSPGYRHVASRLFVSREEAGELFKKIELRLDRDLWEAVKALAPDVIAQDKPARDYLVQLPNGPHAPDCIEITQRAGPLSHARDNDLHIVNAVARFNRSTQGVLPSASELAELARLFDTPPFPEDLTDAQKKELAKRQATVADLMSRIKLNEADQKFRGYLASGEFVKAGALVEELGNAGVDAKPFARVMMSTVKETAEKHAQFRRWGSVASTVANVREGWVKMGVLTDTDYRALNAWEVEAYKGEDEDLYDAFKKAPNRSTCEGYLSNAKIPARAEYAAMKFSVEAYVAYLDRMDGELDLTFKVTNLYMGSRDDFTYRNFTADIMVEGNTVAYQSGQTWLAETSYNIPAFGAPPKTFRRKLNQDVTISGAMWNFTDLTGKRDLGTVSKPVSVRDLIGGKTIELAKTKWYDAKGSASSFSIAVEGVPSPPSVPSYSKGR